MITTLYGHKLGARRLFTDDGRNIVVTDIALPHTIVADVLDNADGKGYLLAIGDKKKTTKQIAGIMKKAGVEKTPRFLRVARTEELATDIEKGAVVSASTVFAVDDTVTVTGTSKGKGFAGVVKRHGFSGGPKTHGQGDRWRAPGSIGAGTTPGRVYRGLRMAGRMGNEKITLKGLKVIHINAETNVLTIKGVIPGAKQSLITVQKIKTT